MSSTDEFPPLLQPGLHKMSVEELKALVVDSFPLSKRRAELWANFLSLVDQLKNEGLGGTIWVDGSFLTEKVDPNDVDFVFDVPIHVLENSNLSQQILLEKIASRGFRKPERLHSFLIFTAPTMHREFAQSQRLHQQWEKDFGFSYVDKTPKGIALVEVQS